MEIAGHALASGILTGAIWFVLILLIFLAMAGVTSWLIVRFIPRGQERIPRHLAVFLCLFSGLLAGLPPGAEVGITKGTLAMGDAVVTGQRRILMPFSSPDKGAADDFKEYVRGEMRVMKEVGVPRYVIQYVALAPILDPAMFVVTLGKELRSPHSTRQVTMSLKETWARARSELSHIATRKMAATIIIGTFFWLLHILAGLALILISRRELVRVSRVLSGVDD